ncbi:hypothetical protein DPEC_G00144260 [Dallia pectoralis]|uniref:Uncharacterized protein n=1 Tax=Dallia pectoralis TaxID=75939 RepID=A0ACC2GNG7_DALPE|nr:hypothetical protein DPEC_G00144260 [Dallia pectoralis]
MQSLPDALPWMEEADASRLRRDSIFKLEFISTNPWHQALEVNASHQASTTSTASLSEPLEPTNTLWLVCTGDFDTNHIQVNGVHETVFIKTEAEELQCLMAEAPQWSTSCRHLVMEQPELTVKKEEETEERKNEKNSLCWSGLSCCFSCVLCQTKQWIK